MIVFLRKDKSIQGIEIRKEYEGFSLDNISFEAKAGEITALVGANGAGKTTLLSILTDQRAPSEGQIFYGGCDLTKNRIQIKKEIGLVQDYNCFYEEYTCNDIKKIMKGFYEKWSDTYFYKLLNIFGLPLRAPMSNFSQGMKKKRLFSVALSHDAQFIILDEITSELDPVTRNDIMEILRDHAEKGATVLFSTHITNDVDRYADRLLMLDKGKLVMNETLSNIRTDYSILEFDLEEFEEAKKVSQELNSQFVKLGHNYLLLTKTEKIINVKCRKAVPTVEDIIMVCIQGGRNEDFDNVD